MGRNIRILSNFELSATDDEIHAVALQFVRKVSGSTRPSTAQQEAFDAAVERIAQVTAHLLADFVTTAQPRDREVEAEKHKARSAKRFARASCARPFARDRSPQKWRPCR